jgi:hypothetical protein
VPPVYGSALTHSFLAAVVRPGILDNNCCLLIIYIIKRDEVIRTRYLLLNNSKRTMDNMLYDRTAYNISGYEFRFTIPGGIYRY